MAYVQVDDKLLHQVAEAFGTTSDQEAVEGALLHVLAWNEGQQEAFAAFTAYQARNQP
jgi:Arc/MetJ family transcription regulator